MTGLDLINPNSNERNQQMSNITNRTWRTSSRCESGACVAVAVGADVVGIRNTTRPDVHIDFDPQVWQRFIAAVKAGELGGGR